MEGETCAIILFVGAFIGLGGIVANAISKWWRNLIPKKGKAPNYTSCNRYCSECGDITEHADGRELGWLCLECCQTPIGNTAVENAAIPQLVDIEEYKRAESIMNQGALQMYMQPFRIKIEYPKNPESEIEEPKHHTRELMII